MLNFHIFSICHVVIRFMSANWFFFCSKIDLFTFHFSFNVRFETHWINMDSMIYLPEELNVFSTMSRRLQEKSYFRSWWNSRQHYDSFAFLGNIKCINFKCLRCSGRDFVEQRSFSIFFSHKYIATHNLTI